MFKKCSIFAKYTKKKSFDCEKYLCRKNKEYKEMFKNKEKWGKCAK